MGLTLTFILLVAAVFIALSTTTEATLNSDPSLFEIQKPRGFSSSDTLLDEFQFPALIKTKSKDEEFPALVSPSPRIAAFIPHSPYTYDPFKSDSVTQISSNQILDRILSVREDLLRKTVRMYLDDGPNSLRKEYIDFIYNKLRDYDVSFNSREKRININLSPSKVYPASVVNNAIRKVMASIGASGGNIPRRTDVDGPKGSFMRPRSKNPSENRKVVVDGETHTFECSWKTKDRDRFLSIDKAMQAVVVVRLFGDHSKLGHTLEGVKLVMHVNCEPEIVALPADYFEQRAGNGDLIGVGQVEEIGRANEGRRRNAQGIRPSEALEEMFDSWNLNA